MNPLAELIGESPGVLAVREKIGRLLSRQTEVRRLPPVLIQGETGTGKGLLARAIHQAGPRSGGPFVDVNCAAIPEALLEAELFGFERGAFTDARHAKPGLFQTAHRGTLFLDELGLLPEGLQAKLLKVIEERSVRRLGSTRSESIDVWIVAATSVDLSAATRERRFREDLYHRLAVLTLWLPPLRERGRDVLLLADHFLARACADYGLAPKAFTPDAQAALTAYRWPGNIRELANVMERVALLVEAPAVTREMLTLPATSPDASQPPDRSAEPVLLSDAVEGVERAHLLEALRDTGWNVTRTAARLGISRNTLRYRIEKHGLRPGTSPPVTRRRVVRAAGVPPASPTPAAQEPGPPPAPAAVRWERRRLTALRVVLPFPPGEGSALDSSRALEVLVEKARIFGGRIEELSPRGIVAIFGLDPVEDAPRRAVLAALAIQKATERAWRRDPEGVGVKAGVHIGQFMLGRVGETSVIDQDAKREAGIVLDELVQGAEADAILVSAAAAPFLERRFDLLPAGPGYRLEGIERAGLRPRGRATTFVGREHDLTLLRSRLESAVRGQGQVVGISGEAGIGKSRLLAEFRQSLGDRPLLYLEGHCLSYGSAIAYLPVLDLVRMGCRLGDTDGPEAVAEKVRLSLEDAGMDAVEATPYLLHLLGLGAGIERLTRLSPEVVKARTLETLRGLTLKLSRRTPLIIVVEDLHWIDRASEEYLASLVEVVAGARILVLATHRPGYRPPWMEKSYATQMALQPLAPEDSLSVLRAVLGRNHVADSLVELILAKAEGNPFFVEELARATREQGGLSATLQVPDTIEELLLARIDRLPPPEKRLLQASAVIGKTVPFGLLRAVVDLNDDALRRALRYLQSAEFLYETSLEPELDYAFKHTLTLDVAYGSLLEEQRRGLHTRIVDAIERLYPDRLAEQTERLAHHAFRGEVWGKALGYLQQAGTRAASRSANREAVTCFEQALIALEHLPASRERSELAVDLRFDLRNALQLLGDFGSILDHLHEAETLARALGDQRRLGRVAAYLTDYFRLVGDQDRALESGQRALGIAESVGDLSSQVSATTWLGQVHLVRGDYRRATVFFRRNVDILVGERSRERFGLPQLPSVHSRTCLVWCLAELGEFAEAVTRGDEAVRIAQSVDQPLNLTVAYAGLGYLYLRRGDIPRAISVLEKSLELIRAWNTPLWFPRVASDLGSAYALAGRSPEALGLLEQAVQRAASMQLMAGHALFVAALGEGHLLAGRVTEAGELARRALALSRDHKARGYEARVLRLLGEIAGRADPLDAADAQDLCRRAMALAGELGMRPLVALSHLSLGRIYRRAEDRPNAEAHLSAATALFREMVMPLWLVEGEAELRTLR